MEKEIIHKSNLFDLGFQHGTPPRWTVTFHRDRLFSKNTGRDPGRPEYFSTIGHALTFVVDRQIKLEPELQAIQANLAEIQQDIEEIKCKVIII